LGVAGAAVVAPIGDALGIPIPGMTILERSIIIVLAIKRSS
jgi:hypothetical protein